MLPYFRFQQTAAAFPAKAKLATHPFRQLPYFTGWLIVLLLLLAASCSKKESEQPEPQTQDLITPAGTPVGAPVTKTIGAAGGTLQSADGQMELSIPAGALSEDREITLQPVTRQLPYGIGQAYRLMPHDIAFQQPVEITFHYDPDSLGNTVPELLGVAYQDQTGQWYSAGEPELDKTKGTLLVHTTHFSDWGFFPYCFLSPKEARVATNEQIMVNVFATVPKDQWDLPPMPGTKLSQTYELPESYLGEWQYAGEGHLEGKGNKAYYTAPAEVPHVNPEAVSVPVKMQRKGQFLLVCNITVRSDFAIDFMQVDETPKSTGGLNYPSRLYLYGSFGNDPGAGNRSVTISNQEVTVAYWTSSLIACDIQTVGPAAKGLVTVTSGTQATSKLLNEWVVRLNYACKQSPDGALTKKIELIIRLRGDADGFTDQELKVEKCNLHHLSVGIAQAAAGSYHNLTMAEGCTHYTVTWQAVAPYVMDYMTTGFEGLRGSVQSTPEGFDLKLSFRTPDILPSHRQSVGCDGTSSSVTDAMEYIALDGFTEVTIPLRFNGKGAAVALKAGHLSGGSGLPATGLYFDNEGYHPEIFTRTLDWNLTQPEIN